MLSNLHIGTCSWKYESWVGILYSPAAKKNFLKEYAEHYDTVEVDQWFWSLFKGHEPKLPTEKVVQEYYDSTPEDFKFTIKVPNAITLTHYYKHGGGPLEENPYFLSEEVFDAFLDRIRGLGEKIGPLILQFEYLNKQKMKSQAEFQEKLGRFVSKYADSHEITVETRNPQSLNENYFQFLKDHGVSPTLLQGYYMPSITEALKKFSAQMTSPVIIRLHGPDRKGMEAETGSVWNQIVSPKDDELEDFIPLVKDLLDRDITVFINVNNHYEGSAPLTIDKILSKL